MPATPAWPPKSLPRLFVRQPLGEGARVELEAGQANYLGNVLRLGVGAELLVFDGMSGEWLGRIADAAKKRMTLTVERQTREPESIPDVWLAFAPVKRAQTDWLVEKATELGVAAVRFLTSERAVRGVDAKSLARLRRIAGAALEQCGGARLPVLSGPHELADPSTLALPARVYVLDPHAPEPLPTGGHEAAAVLIGPEGGWSNTELATLETAATPVRLGGRVLRVETAAIAAAVRLLAG